MLIDLWMDGYETDEEHKQACIEYVKEQLDSTAISVKILKVDDEISEECSR